MRLRFYSCLDTWRNSSSKFQTSTNEVWLKSYKLQQMTFGSEVWNIHKWLLAQKFETFTNGFWLSFKKDSFIKYHIGELNRYLQFFSWILDFWIFSLLIDVSSIVWNEMTWLSQSDQSETENQLMDVGWIVWNEMTWLSQSDQSDTKKPIDRCQLNCLTWNDFVVSWHSYEK